MESESDFWCRELRPFFGIERVVRADLEFGTVHVGVGREPLGIVDSMTHQIKQLILLTTALCPESESNALVRGYFRNLEWAIDLLDPDRKVRREFIDRHGPKASRGFWHQVDFETDRAVGLLHLAKVQVLRTLGERKNPLLRQDVLDRLPQQYDHDQVSGIEYLLAVTEEGAEVPGAVLTAFRKKGFPADQLRPDSINRLGPEESAPAGCQAVGSGGGVEFFVLVVPLVLAWLALRRGVLRPRN